MFLTLYLCVYFRTIIVNILDSESKCNLPLLRIPQFKHFMHVHRGKRNLEVQSGPILKDNLKLKPRLLYMTVKRSCFN